MTVSILVSASTSHNMTKHHHTQCKSGPKDQVALHYYYTLPSHWWRLTRYRNWKFHNGCHTISWHADGISWYSVPPSAGPLLPLIIPIHSISIQCGTTLYLPTAFTWHNNHQLPCPPAHCVTTVVIPVHHICPHRPRDQTSYLSTASTCSNRSCRSSVRCFTTVPSPSSVSSARQSLSASPWRTVDSRSSLNSCFITRWSARNDSVCSTSLGNSVSWRWVHSCVSDDCRRDTFSANFSIACIHRRDNATNTWCS